MFTNKEYRAGAKSASLARTTRPPSAAGIDATGCRALAVPVKGTGSDDRVPRDAQIEGRVTGEEIRWRSRRR